MTSFGYPVFLELAGRRCVVIGDIAVRVGKVEGLLIAGADDVLVVAEGPLERLARLEVAADVRVERRGWRPHDLDGAFLVVAASPDRDERDAIGHEARSRHVLVNVMDDVPNCDWAAPAIVRRGDLTLAVGTGGVSPAVASRVRQRLEAEYGEEWGELLRVVGRVRLEVTERIADPDERADRWRRVYVPGPEALRMSGEELREVLLDGLGLVPEPERSP